jgi:outer membrane receptor for ferrienterochelin and colicin
MDISKIATILLFSFLCGSMAAQPVIISGYVTDEDRENLIGASINLHGSNIGAISNTYGFFSIKTIPGDVRLIFSMASLKSDTISLKVQNDTSIYVTLKNRTLSEVVVSDNRLENKAQMSSIRLSLAQVAKMPALAGEADIIKALSFTPGVTNGGEGSAGLFVRGGTPDQNLILLDNAVVYNPNHLFGFLSVFNPSTLKSVELMRGGFPARYGGRLSSVLEITMKDGSQERRKGEVGLGLIGSHAQIEGPWARKRGSYMIAGRVSYLSLLLLPLRLQYMSGKRNQYQNYSMHDINAKLRLQLNQKSQAFLSFYTGYDRFKILNQTDSDKSKNQLGWGNLTASLRLNRQVLPQTYWKNTLVYSQFRYKYDFEFIMQADSIPSESRFASFSGLKNITWKSEWDFMPNSKHYFRAGIENTCYKFVPRDNSLSLHSADTTYISKTSNSVQAYESAAYIEDEWRPTDVWSLNVGLRANFFSIQNLPFLSVEPRLSLSRRIGYFNMLKASFARTQQNIHLLSNSGLGFQNDVWVPVTSQLLPQRTFQVAIGFEHDFPKQFIEMALEIYYKKMSNQIEYREGVNIFSSQQQAWADLVAGRGRGESYGIELSFSKQVGQRLTGLLAYTLSKTTRQFDDINGGKVYPFKYDFPHNLNATASLKLNKKWDFAATWVWHSGQAFSLPTIALSAPPNAAYEGTTLFYFKDRNNARLPDYVRADIGFILTKPRKNGRTAIWNFSVFNVLNRPNALYAYIQNRPVFDAQTQGHSYYQELKTQSFLPILPSISYVLKY